MLSLGDVSFLGVPHLRDDEVPPQGGKPGWAAPPSPRIGPWLRLLKTIAQSQNLIPEFEVLFYWSYYMCLCTIFFFMLGCIGNYR